MTEYFVVAENIAQGKTFNYGKSPTLKEARKKFDILCETFVKEKFKIIRKTVTEEVVCESEDYRQKSKGKRGEKGYVNFKKCYGSSLILKQVFFYIKCIKNLQKINTLLYKL